MTAAAAVVMMLRWCAPGTVSRMGWRAARHWGSRAYTSEQVGLSTCRQAERVGQDLQAACKALGHSVMSTCSHNRSIETHSPHSAQTAVAPALMSRGRAYHSTPVMQAQAATLQTAAEVCSKPSPAL